MEDNPKVVVSSYSDEDNLITAHLVWIYPHPRIEEGARLVYFRSNTDKRLICYIHHEAISSDVDLPDDELYLCKLATNALYEKGISIMENYDVFSDFNEW